MKKLIAIFALIMMGNFGTAIAQKLAHIDFQKIMLALPERKAAEDTLKKEAEKFQADANRMKIKLDQLMAEYQDQKQKGLFSTPASEQMAVENINDYQGRMQQFQEYAEEALAKKESDLLKPMYDKVKASVKKIMKANGINYVVDVNALIDMDGGFDLTPLVAKDLNVVLPATTPN